ncbi:MAG TPA: type IV secretory system conjugative DNA transfer family protein [Rhizomicrobium sp.]|nr:type IV secretory system conjugative DNA transfer family protein [Rhizomicrobium sp.]
MTSATDMPFGDACFASREELDAHGLLTDSPATLPLGQVADEGEPLDAGYDGERHMLVFGPNGSGKSTRFAATALLRSDASRSWVVVDPKGELAAITAPYRRTVGAVHIVNPFGTLANRTGYDDLRSGKFNPLAGLDPESPSFNADAALIAEALITMEGTQPFFPRSARNLVAALTMWEATQAMREGRAPLLGNVRDMLTNPAGLPETLGKIALSGNRGMANKAGPLMQEARSIRDVISEAATQTEFLDDVEMVGDMSGTGPDFAAMKDKPATVYLILPAGMMERHTKWFRLVLSAALRALMVPKEPGQLPVTFLLDEYFLIANGGLTIIENCMAYVRGFGIQLIPMLQDLNQLQDLYPKRWQTFLSNAGIVMHIGPPADLTTAEWMSRRAGDTTTYAQSISDNTGIGFGGGKASFNQGGGMSKSQTRVPFLPVHELFDTDPHHAFSWKAGLANTVRTCLPLSADTCLGERSRKNPYFASPDDEPVVATVPEKPRLPSGGIFERRRGGSDARGRQGDDRATPPRR